MKPRLKSSKKRQGARQKRPQDRPVSAETRDPKALRTSLRVIWFLLLTAIAGVMGYFIMLTGFSAYDDEGMMMLTVKQYIDGAKLYETIFTFYGPVYYFYNWALRILTTTPVTHDVVRMSSLLPCLVGVLICAWIVLRLTGSMAMATLVHLFACLTIIGFSHAEPGHPPATLRHAYWPDHVPWVELGDKLPRVAGFDK